MDELDYRLVKLLEQNAWQSSLKLAKALGTSSATVRRRLRRLTQKGLLRAVALADPSIAAPTLTAIIGLDIAHQDMAQVIKLLAGLPETMWCALATGRFDILVLAQFYSMGELDQFLQEKLATIEGIRDSETFVCLHVEKGRHLLSID